MPPYTKEGFDAGNQLFDYLTRLGKEKGCTFGQLPLAWMLCKRRWIVPIPGTTKLFRLKDNLKAVDVAFTQEELAEFSETISAIEIHGDRYPDSYKGGGVGK